MRKYIVDLTNNLIGKHRSDPMYDWMINGDAKIPEGSNPWEQFTSHVTIDLLMTDIKAMKPHTLGEIMCSFEHSDVLTKHPGKEVCFGGDAEGMFREIVALCLACVIRDRLDPRRPDFIPAYRIKPVKNWQLEIERDVPYTTREQILAEIEKRKKRSQ